MEEISPNQQKLNSPAGENNFRTPIKLDKNLSMEILNQAEAKYLPEPAYNTLNFNNTIFNSLTV